MRSCTPLNAVQRQTIYNDDDDQNTSDWNRRERRRRRGKCEIEILIDLFGYVHINTYVLLIVEIHIRSIGLYAQ